MENLTNGLQDTKNQIMDLLGKQDSKSDQEGDKTDNLNGN